MLLQGWIFIGGVGAGGLGARIWRVKAYNKFGSGTPLRSRAWSRGQGAKLPEADNSSIIR